MAWKTGIHDQSTQTGVRQVLNRLMGTGVIPLLLGEFAPSAPGGMFIAITTGGAALNGYVVENDAVTTVPIASNSSGQTRYDRVVVRFNDATNLATIAPIQGVPGGGAPALTRAGSTFEISLCYITIPTGTTDLTTANIADERSNAAVCGWARPRQWLAHDIADGVITPAKLGGVSLTGTLAARPAATAATIGRFYFATDAGVLYRDNGTAWQVVSPGRTLIQTQSLQGAQLISFASIPQVFRHLELDIFCRTNEPVEFSPFFLRFNGNFAAAYSYQASFARTASVTASEGLNGTHGLLGYCPGSAAAIGAMTTTRVLIPFYTDTSFWRQWRSEAAQVHNLGASGGIGIYGIRGTWTATNPASSLEVLCTGGSTFTLGSVAHLYGIL